MEENYEVVVLADAVPHDGNINVHILLFRSIRDFEDKLGILQQYNVSLQCEYIYWPVLPFQSEKEL